MPISPPRKKSQHGASLSCCNQLDSRACPFNLADRFSFPLPKPDEDHHERDRLELKRQSFLARNICDRADACCMTLVAFRQSQSRPSPSRSSRITRMKSWLTREPMRKTGSRLHQIIRFYLVLGSLYSCAQMPNDSGCFARI